MWRLRLETGRGHIDGSQFRIQWEKIVIRMGQIELGFHQEKNGLVPSQGPRDPRKSEPIQAWKSTWFQSHFQILGFLKIRTNPSLKVKKNQRHFPTLPDPLIFENQNQSKPESQEKSKTFSNSSWSSDFWKTEPIQAWKLRSIDKIENLTENGEIERKFIGIDWLRWIIKFILRFLFWNTNLLEYTFLSSSS